MQMKEIIKNEALGTSPVGFEMPEVVACRDENGVFKYRRKPKALEYLENGDVQFNLCYWPAPGAVESAEIEVVANPDRRTTGRYPMEKAGFEWWQTTVSGIPGGVHSFQLYVNGLPCIHPGAPVMFNGTGISNFCDVPDEEDETYLMRDVPHGTVRIEYYPCSVTERMRNCLVYTPPGYDESDREYPVLYLQHGGGENEMNWFFVANANLEMDNMIADGLCEEMLVVCNNGYVYSPHDDYTDKTSIGNLGPLLIKDCAPFIEKKFRVKKGKENRALAGLSMGSHQAQLIAYKNPEFADYIAMMSGATLATRNDRWTHHDPVMEVEDYYTDIEKFNASHKLLFVSMGMQEGGEAFLENMKPYIERGIQAELFVCEGAHEFQAWRRMLYVFCQKLFGR